MHKILEKLLSIFIPEETKLNRLLSLEPSLAFGLLPKSNLHQTKATAIFDYQNRLVRLLIKALKFKNNPRARKFLAQIVCDELLPAFADRQLFSGRAPILVPIPMSSKEERERGFNPCFELAQEIRRASGAEIEIKFDCLRKIKDTKRQIKLSRKERLKNLKNTMQVFDPQNQIRGRDIVVLDDLYTTGSTFAEASRALTQAGARSVAGLFLAH